MFKVPEKYRVTGGDPRYASTAADGNNGLFRVPANRRKPLGAKLAVIASDGEGWAHVSVSTQTRCPTWEEMCMIKALFWSDEDCVVQYHPPSSEYVNCHPYCLHLWQPLHCALPLPPSILVGPGAGL